MHRGDDDPRLGRLGLSGRLDHEPGGYAPAARGEDRPKRRGGLVFAGGHWLAARSDVELRLTAVEFPIEVRLGLVAVSSIPREGAAMVTTAKWGNVLLTAVLAVAAFGFGAGRAEAQWGGGFGGFGMGFGGGMYTYIPQPVTTVNQVGWPR